MYLEIAPALTPQLDEKTCRSAEFEPNAQDMPENPGNDV